jgi:hypothetical protein
MRARHIGQELGAEVEAPSGHYKPLEERFLGHEGRRLLYTLGSACIEVSCCGVGDWQYARVEGYLVEDSHPRGQGDPGGIEIDTIDDERERAAIAKLLEEEHPGVRIEFR